LALFFIITGIWLSQGRGCRPQPGRGGRLSGVSKGGLGPVFRINSSAPHAGFVFRSKEGVVFACREASPHSSRWVCHVLMDSRKKPAGGRPQVIGLPTSGPFAWSGFWELLGTGRQKWPCSPGGRRHYEGGGPALDGWLPGLRKLWPARVFWPSCSSASAGTGRNAFAAAVTPVIS